ncbi:hypothetical protein FHR81_003915 [Actinoalloteichus hoggarensis]|uniref:Uncharacterized protein n=1 Tax=Actinoalloteichus hoggarensis TaxID=1470176 RepID=A0A221VW14_9PSEU|nr:DUF6474 family protein [Actinoalloteichus hoggarensis]ASO17732.1 hypothetical protein AHOG_00285 [Actinoalloteichus hoggarensis]MBB5922858.1 hypothetical protein [Actinoalloteichus hoggarensis]
MARRKKDDPASKGRGGRRLTGLAKALIPVAAPVLLPFAAGAAASARDAVDRLRARRLGVPVERLAEFSGRGAALHARIVGVREALDALRERDGDKHEDARFAVGIEPRLRQLLAAVRAAERMPAERRRAAHRAVDAELAQVEDELLRRFGLSTRLGSTAGGASAASGRAQAPRSAAG